LFKIPKNILFGVAEDTVSTLSGATVVRRGTQQAGDGPSKVFDPLENLSLESDTAQQTSGDPQEATYLDVAVIRCLLIKHWAEDGVFWALKRCSSATHSESSSLRVLESARRSSVSTTISLSRARDRRGRLDRNRSDPSLTNSSEVLSTRDTRSGSVTGLPGQAVSELTKQFFPEV
uniref:Pecanex-like protein n=1 Tax=Gongylonema pulchrum TaxID=637853 RepID=A0A183EIX4_9BILA